MPILNWIGKDAVVNHDKDVPFRLLKKNKSKSVGDSENLIIEGDNLEALKALLPHYQNKIKCIYIDPPYNTGTENWIYNDNVNSPKIKKWLGKIVGGEGEDLTRHDKWLCMMYPRLKLLRELLRNDGVVFISIDDGEHDILTNIMKEIFGEENFIANIVWQKKYAPQSDAKYFTNMHDFIVVFAKQKITGNVRDGWKRNLMPRTEKQNAAYRYDDDNGRGKYRTDNLSVKRVTKEYLYSITNPQTGKEYPPPKGRSYFTKKSSMDKLIKENRIYFGSDGKGAPQLKRYLGEVQEGVVPITWWDRIFAGDNQESKQELNKIFEGSSGFETPKPVKLITRILELSTNKNDIVLDFFAGSGTTGHAVLQLNKKDGGNRKFILVELESEICKNITSQRVKKAIKGYEDIPGTGGGFQYAVLDKRLFNSDGRINDTCTFEELASYVYFTETKTILDTKKIKKTLLGKNNDTEYHLIFDGIGKNNLDRKFLTSLDRNEDKVIYADKCTLDDSTLEKYNTVFKQIPYEVREF